MGKNERVKNWVEAYVESVLKYRIVVIAGCLLVCLAAASGGRLIKFNDSVRYFFKAGDARLVAAEQLETIYSKEDNILFAVSHESGGFHRDALSAMEMITEEAWKIPYATRVDSVTNFQYSYADGDELIVGDLVEDSAGLTNEELEQRRVRALAQPQLAGRLISASGDVVGANITLTLPGEKDNEQAPSVEAARSLVDQVKEAFPDVDVRLGGITMLNHTFPEAAKGDLTSLVPLMYLVLLVALGFLLRSVAFVVATALVIALSTVTAVGSAGWAGIQLSPPSTTATTMIMTLAVADCVHLLVSVRHHLRAGMSKRDAIAASLKSNFAALLLTSLTTAIGFASMNFSSIQPLNDLGNITTVGVVVAFVLSVSFLPALVSFLPAPRVPQTTSALSRWGDALGAWIARHHRRLVWVPLVLVAGLGAFIPRNVPEDRFLTYFDDSFQFRRDADFIVDRLTGIYTLEFSLDSGRKGGISDPAYLATIDEFAEWYREQPGVVHVSSFTDTMKRLNQNMNADQPSFYRVPTDKQLSAQYLLFFEMSLPYGLDLNNTLNVAKSSTRMIVTMGDVSSVRMRELAEGGEQWLRDHGPPSMQATPSSTSVMFAYASGENIANMVPGTMIAFGLISIVLMFAFRSVRHGLLSLIPNVAPTVAAFGLWGLLVGRINFGIAMVASVSLGIIVDDTVHFLSKYLEARRAGADAETAVRKTLSTVGPALIVTSLVLVMGFSVVASSAFGINAGMGQLTAVTITLALVMDLLVLPALLLTLDGRRAKVTSPDGQLAPTESRSAA